MAISEIERGLLQTAERYGDGLDLSGPRVSRSVKAVATDLITSGHLAGRLKSLSLTPLGRAALAGKSS